MKKKLNLIPVPLLPTMVGACTLGNVYMGFGFTWLRNLIFVLAAVLVVFYIGKLVMNTETCKKEYDNTILCSLYGGFSMLLMLIGSFLFAYVPALGKGLWFAGVIIHAVHICVFTYKNVLKGVQIPTFMPSWFVTYNGIMVAVVTGGAMNQPMLTKIITYYGILIFTVIIPFMVWRLVKKPIGDAVYHTQAVLLAPCSLCVVSYLNAVENPNRVILYYLYAAVLLSLFFIIYKLPSFFRFSFTPAFAGLTFPMAIGTVATGRFAGYLEAQNMVQAAGVLKQLQGLQILLTTGIIFYVLLQFFILLKKNLQEA
ncbi:MAG: TDT family transporter [Lachnospiraceae bacterium]|nr:TDT family transporter [Lachnospiraceae bacterium]